MPDRLLDANAISAAMKRQETFEQYLAALPPDDALLTSVVVEGEIRFGIARLPHGRRKKGLGEAFLQILASLDGILAITRPIANRYAELKFDLWRRGRPMGENDLWIAATASAHRLTVVTSDAIFKNIRGLPVEHW